MRFRVFSFLVPIFLLTALSWGISVGLAEVPRDTLERLAQISVEKQEIRHLNALTKITSQEYNVRLKTLNTEERTLWNPYRRLPSAEMQASETAIRGLSRSKLSLLEPQWEKEEWAFRKDTEKRKEQTALEVNQSAREAVEFQRQRMILQRQLDKGTIDRATFTTKDHEALVAIEALRNKHDPHYWGARFDNRLSLLTKALADNPDTFIARSQVPATGEGEPDFEKDVKLAVGLLVKNEEISWKFEKKQVSIDTLRESATVYGHDLSRLRARYDAISPKRGEQFEAAYKRLAAPELQALKVKYYPERYRPAAPTGQITQPPPPATDYTLWYWIGGGVILLIIFALGSDDEEPAPAPKPITSDIYGSADWAAYEKIPTTHTNVSRGVTFGKSSVPEYKLNTVGAPITSQPESHTLIIAQSGAGKGTRVIIPTLLRYASSMLVIDPKGENAAITARTRKNQLRQEIQIINPWGVLKDHYSKLGFQTATFNPLDVLDRNDPNITSIARTLAKTISPTTDAKSEFWQGSAAKVLTGIFLWLTHRDGLDEEKTLARVQEIVNLPKQEFQKILVQMLASEAFNGDLRQQVGQMADSSAADTYGGIMLHLQERTNFIDTAIKTSTAASTFSMDKLSDGTLTVYLVIPFKLMDTHSTWLRLVISSAMHSLIKSREAASGSPLHRCMFMIDEFGSIGHMPDIAKNLAQMRGYGMDFTLILQGLNQLKEHYSDARDSIIGNCRYKYFCDVNDLESAKYLSETLGKKTVQTVSTSTSQGATQAGQTEGSSTSYGETGRALLTPDEIMHLGKNTAILLNPDTRPHYLHPVDYWRLQQTYQHLRNSDPHLYWNPPLTYDQNPTINPPENPFANFRLPPGFLEHFPPMTWDKTKRK